MREHVGAEDLGGYVLETRGVRERRQAEIRDRRDAVGADQHRRIDPDQAINEAGAQQRRREPAAAFDQQPSQAARAQHTERRGQIDTASRIWLCRDQLDPGVT